MSSLYLHRISKRRHYGAPLLIVAPQILLESHCHKMLIRGRFRGRLKLSLPVVSLVKVALQVIEYPLFTPVEAHFANVCGEFRKKTTFAPTAAY